MWPDSGKIDSSELGALIKEVMGEELTPLELQRAMDVLDEDGGGTEVCLAVLLPKFTPRLSTTI